MPVLASWREGAAKSAITDFVARVTRTGGTDYVPPEGRIATFDNDGTLWCEQPVQMQGLFLMARAHAIAKTEPEKAKRPAFQALLAGDRAALQALGMKGIAELMVATHSGMTAEEFEAIVLDWFGSARHPIFKRPILGCVYQPQLELLEYLRDNGFRTFIVSGGGIDMMRAISERAYGIPRDQVVGSSARLKFEIRDGRGVLVKLPELDSFDDREAKPANIGLHIGRRPILTFGNSDGDLAMLRYTKTGDAPRLALLLHHDDADREVAYDRDFRLSPLVEALDKADEYGIQLVSMKNDWGRVFPEGGS